MLAVNAPVLVPIFSKAFWKRGPYRPGRQVQGGGIFGGGGGNRNGQRPAGAPRPTVFEIPSDMTWTTQGVSHGTSQYTERSKLSRPGNTVNRDRDRERDLENGPDAMSGPVEMRATERLPEQPGEDDMAISPCRDVG
jgi:hypothetical protein